MSDGNNGEDDFRPEKEIRRVSNVLDQPDKFAAVFSNAIKKSKDMDDAIGSVVIDLLKKDSNTRDTLKQVIREVEREDWRYWIKKFGWGVWSIFLVIASIIVTAAFKLFIK